MIVEQRTYTLKPGKTAAYLDFYRKNCFDIQTAHLSKLLGYYVTEFGALNRIVHMWAYDSHADRERRRAALFADERWLAVVGQLYDMIDHMENCILLPTSLSPDR